MSFPVMPTMPLGMAKGLKKSPHFNTSLETTAGGRGNSAISLMPYPTWDFEFDMDSIQGNEALASSVLAQFVGTFMLCQGSAQTFLFTDPQDSTVSLANSGMLNVTPGATAPMGTTGDGTSTQFQLARLIGGIAYDVIQNVNGALVVKVNGTATSAYTISSTGVITFTTAPANLATLTWSGSFYFLCRFAEDTIDATRAFTKNNGTDLWDVESVKFSSEFI